MPPRQVLRPFLARYRYSGPLLTLAFAVAAFLAGVGEGGGGWAIAAPLALGAFAAAVVCLGWDLWLHP